MTLLDRIVADTRTLVERRKAAVPVAELESRAFFHGPTLPLAPALRRDGLAVIAELKPASPSKGPLRPDLNVADVARQYKTHGAAALSILTEPFHFKGSIDNLARARQVVDLPLLRKDFIVDPYQLVEARAYGADAVLLIAAVLERTQLAELHHAAEELGLSCLVEVYDPRELDHVDLDQVRVLGVNNRDLRTFEVDLRHAARVLQAVPPAIVRVAESGIRTADEMARLRREGLDAVLMGETLMRAPEPGAHLGALLAATRALLRGPALLPA